MVRLLAAVLLVTLGCSREQARPAGVSVVEPEAGGITPSEDTGTIADTAIIPSDSATTPLDAGADVESAPDFGPVEDVVTGGGGPVIDPGGGGTTIGCAADTALLGKLTLTPSSSTPKAFVDAWNSEMAKLPHGGLLLELRGLTGSTLAAKLAVGSPKPTTPIAFVDVPAPGVVDLSFNVSTRVLSGPRQDVSTMLFDSKLFVGALAFRGTLDAKCTSATAVTLTLLVPVTAGSSPFGGSTISALLGAPNDVITPTDAWRIELSGSVGGAS